MNDVHVACVVSSIGWWRSIHMAPFVVIHDESTHFFKRKDMWDTVSSLEASEGTVAVGGKSIQFPLRVSSTVAGKSELLPALQVCDIVAGFVAKIKSDRLKPVEKAVLGEMLKSGMGEIMVDGIEPDGDFPDGGPAAASGPDAVDQIARLIFHK